MNVYEYISPWLRNLLDEYHFNKETLAKYLSVSTKTVNDLAQGKEVKLPDDYNKVLDKILFLSIIPKEVPDLKVKAFLEVLLSYHKLSKDTIAKMAGVEISDIENFLCEKYEYVDFEIRYKIASVTMALRFFLKDNEL